MIGNETRAALGDCKRIVVKIGSRALCADGGRFDLVAKQVATQLKAGRKVVLVSSGAVALGRVRLGLTDRPKKVSLLQAAAATGQSLLMRAYEDAFAPLGIHVAQVLLTHDVVTDRDRYLHARQAIDELLKLGVVPIINENDTVATEEIRFGDNDNLSATVVNLVGADLLVILTDVDGLYDRPPSEAGEASPRLYDVVESIGAEIERAAQGSTSAFGRGGMTTKLQAAQAAARCGASTVLCNGNAKDVLLRVAAGERVGTLVLAGSRIASRKHWLAFTLGARGALVIDEGAARALVERGKSLLAAGIVEVRGKFAIGDPVACVDPSGRELARGLVAYGSEEIRRIARRPAREIAQVLGYSNGDEVIHRDDLVLSEGPPE
jgi:glutamate 5-kinase